MRLIAALLMMLLASSVLAETKLYQVICWSNDKEIFREKNLQEAFYDDYGLVAITKHFTYVITGAECVIMYRDDKANQPIPVKK